MRPCAGSAGRFSLYMVSLYMLEVRGYCNYAIEVSVVLLDRSEVSTV